MSEYYNRVKSNSLDFYLHSLLGGYQFRVVGNALEVNPAHAIDEEMAMLIKQHKAELIKLLGSIYEQ